MPGCRLCFTNQGNELNRLGFCPTSGLRTAATSRLLNLHIKASFPHPHPRGHLHCMDKVTQSPHPCHPRQSHMKCGASVLPIQAKWHGGQQTGMDARVIDNLEATEISICCQRRRPQRCCHLAQGLPEERKENGRVAGPKPQERGGIFRGTSCRGGGQYVHVRSTLKS